MTDLEARIDEIERRLRAWCKDREIRIAPDGSVSERDASGLCGYADRSRFAQRVAEGLSVPRHRAVPGRKIHRRYLVRDCAVWLAGQYDGADGDSGF